jgi:hypothetical protein
MTLDEKAKLVKEVLQRTTELMFLGDEKKRLYEYNKFKVGQLMDEYIQLSQSTMNTPDEKFADLRTAILTHTEVCMDSIDFIRTRHKADLSFFEEAQKKLVG